MAGFCVVGVPIVAPPGPPPPPAPMPVASTVVLGTSAANNSAFTGPPGNISVVWGAPANIGPLQAGDVLIAGIVVYHEPHPGVDITDFTGGLPSGWTMVSNNPNPGNPANHGPMYVGLASHVVTAGEGPQPTYNFSLSGAGAVANAGAVIMCAARNSLGIEAFTAAQTAMDGTGTITAPAVATAYNIELVFILGFGVGFGANTLSSTNGHTTVIDPSGGTPTVGVGMFYYFSTGATAPAQGVSESRGGVDNDAMSAYQVSMLPGAA